jgi:uncharacterized protein (UPF0335 family)
VKKREIKTKQNKTTHQKKQRVFQFPLGNGFATKTLQRFLKGKKIQKKKE